MSELSTDVRQWPTVKHFTCWLGLCPNFQKTGGKVKSSRTRKGKNRAAQSLRIAAFTLLKSHSVLGAFMRRKRAHLGAPKAITTTAHKLARIIDNMVRYGLAYQRQSEADELAAHRARMEKNLRRRAKQLGYELHKIDPPEGEVSATEVPPVA